MATEGGNIRHSGVVTWNLWHIRDSEARQADRNGCMWFEDYTPKPAYYALKDILLNPPD